MTKEKEIKNIVDELCDIGYDIIDNIISPVCGINNVVADLYFVNINTYTTGDEKENKRICKEITKKYNLDQDLESLLLDMPIMLIALMILENQRYM